MYVSLSLLIFSFIHSFIHSFFHSFIHSFIHCSFICLFNLYIQFVITFICSFFCLFIYSFILHHSFITSFSLLEMLSCTERQMVRTYPKGTRFDSSNYDPMAMWTCGVQLVALNFQKPDLFMHLNQGFFRNNGGCGYILKPKVMRCEDPGGPRILYSPDIQVPLPKVTPINLEIEVRAWKV